VAGGFDAASGGERKLGSGFFGDGMLFVIRLGQKEEKIINIMEANQLGNNGKKVR